MPAIKTKSIGAQQGWEAPEVLKSVTLRIKTLYDPKEHVGPHDSTVQNGTASLIVDDKPAGDLKLTLWNCVLPKTARGKTVVISSERNQKNHLAGVEYVIDEYTNKEGEEVRQEGIKVSGLASMSYLDGSSAEQAVETVERHVLVTSAPSKPRPGESFRDIVLSIAKAHRVTAGVVEEVYGSMFKTLPEAAQQAFISTVFIQAFDRYGGAWFTEQSQPQETEPIPEPEYDPENWACAIVPSGKKYKGKTLGEIGKTGLRELYEFMEERDFKFRPQGFADCVKQAGEVLLNLAEPKESWPEDGIP